MMLSVREAAVEYGVSEQTIRALIRRGLIPAVRLSPRSTRIDVSALRKSMEKVKADKKAS